MQAQIDSIDKLQQARGKNQLQWDAEVHKRRCEQLKTQISNRWRHQLQEEREQIMAEQRQRQSQYLMSIRRKYVNNDTVTEGLLGLADQEHARLKREEESMFELMDAELRRK